MSKVRVLIADDSALMRRLLSEILGQDPEIEVVGTVSDAFKAREEIKRLDPDVLTLDIEMPKMDGISFLEKLMRLRPMPVVMISAMTEKGADITMKALMLGAVDFISKPKVDIENNLDKYSGLIRSKVKTAAASKLNRRPLVKPGDSPKSEPGHRASGPCGYEVIAIGASTGGVETIHEILSRLPLGLPPIVVTQHIPPVFSASFANRLNEQLELEVCEASDGQRLRHSNVYVAPGDQHLMVARENSQYICRLRNDEPVNRHMPSVEVLFNSVAETIGKKSIGVLLTGMGSDGAKGLLTMSTLGAITIAQDRESSTVWGMPRAAIELGAAQFTLPPDKIHGKLLNLCLEGKKKGEVRERFGT